MIGLLKFVLWAAWLLVTIGVLINIWQRSQQSSLSKVLWTLGILLFPFLGPLAWILFGERTNSLTH
jgi:hypothetical protein